MCDRVDVVYWPVYTRRLPPHTTGVGSARLRQCVALALDTYLSGHDGTGARGRVLLIGLVAIWVYVSERVQARRRGYAFNRACTCWMAPSSCCAGSVARQSEASTWCVRVVVCMRMFVHGVGALGCARGVRGDGRYCPPGVQRAIYAASSVCARRCVCLYVHTRVASSHWVQGCRASAFDIACGEAKCVLLPMLTPARIVGVRVCGSRTVPAREPFAAPDGVRAAEAVVSAAVGRGSARNPRRLC